MITIVVAKLGRMQHESLNKSDKYYNILDKQRWKVNKTLTKQLQKTLGRPAKRFLCLIKRNLLRVGQASGL